MPTDVTITIVITNAAPSADVEVSAQAASRPEWDVPLPDDTDDQVPLPDETDDQQEAYPPLPDDELEDTPTTTLELPDGEDHPEDFLPEPESAPS